MIAVKICGINSEASYRAAVAVGATWLGFNFYPRSPRWVTPEHVVAMAGDDWAPSVGLFVEPEDAAICAVLGACRLDVLQLYASAERCRAVRERFGLPVWRAVGVSALADLPRDDEGLDGFVIEAKAPDGADRPGGNGLRLDWAMLRGWRSPAPWLLAGGLTVENVGAAIAASGAHAVDVASGVETAPGQKSAALIEAFVVAARQACETGQ
ncbi:MAG TPA: phosphoribosylanthranilate isomerase [Acidiphilium sp.]|nr:MAG: N-(5'-phosphoribosyl)anthranilate isomerase [Acidiphilium sp. 21-60-14]OYV90129.1 MAG: N-(5'-phosphoribosyl)anthranilate isomerase [Acidiphilium sp. 37-60-79]OZB41331.1 MAG: N-(5'-phosphoribosyl)anthranilate isomerase [Acidiphilium sp. 34-60-192]HQT88874.1 phosphoribosylanthranilate isomerase [Acidiphilium sp.]HQU25094.1 phosphoribosylanthranilate isomerase [Acidiphilium sp.]